MNAEQLAHTIAREASTVEGYTVRVLDKSTGIEHAATAPSAESRDACMQAIERHFGPLDRNMTEIAVAIAMRHDEVSRECEAVFDRLSLDEQFDLSWIGDA